MRVAKIFQIAALATGIGGVGVTASDKTDEPETAAAFILKGQKKPSTNEKIQ